MPCLQGAIWSTTARGSADAIPRDIVVAVVAHVCVPKAEPGAARHEVNQANAVSVLQAVHEDRRHVILPYSCPCAWQSYEQM